MIYAGFWRRFFASCIDTLLLVFPLTLFAWISSFSRELSIAVVVPHLLFDWYYFYYFHAKSGQTPGKQAMGIRVMRVDGSRIGRAESFRRGAVDLVFGGIWIVGRIWGISQVSPGDFERAEWLQQQDLIQKMQPAFTSWASIAMQIWMWSEVVTMLFNRRRRAIHDFIAGTVVVRIGRKV